LGYPQAIRVLYDELIDEIISYEWQAKLTPDMKPPYQEVVLAVKSLAELIDQYQQFIDKQFNRAASRNSVNANPIGGMHRDAVEEEPDELEVSTQGGLFNLKNGKELADFIEFAKIPDNDDRTLEILNLVFHLVQLWLGVSNLSQGDYEDIPRNNTATGIHAVLEESSRLGRRWTREIKSGTETLMLKCVKLQGHIIEIEGREEIFRYSNGNAEIEATITPEEIRDLEFDVTLVLQREDIDADIAAAERAIALQDQYFLVPLPDRVYRRPLFANMMKSLGFPDVEILLPLPTPEQIQGYIEQQEQMAQDQADAEAESAKAKP